MAQGVGHLVDHILIDGALARWCPAIAHLPVLAGHLAEHRRLDALATRGEGREGSRLFQRCRRGRSQHVVQLGAQPRGVHRDARGHDRLVGLVPTDFLVHLHERCVDRVDRGRQHADLAVVRVAVVGHLVVGDRHGGRAAVGGVQAHPVAQPGGQSEGLECGAGLTARLRGVVELVGRVVLATVEGLHRTGISGHRCHADAQTLDVLGGLVVVHRVDRRHLGLHVERGDHRQTPREQIVLGESLLQEFLLSGCQQEAVGTGVVIGERLVRLDLGECGGGALLRGQPTFGLH